MAALRPLLSLVIAFAFAVPASAQWANTGALAAPMSWNASAISHRSYLGLNPGRAPSAMACESIELLCTQSRDWPSQLYAGTALNDAFRVEVGVLNFGRLPHFGTEARAQGLNFSLVGNARLGRSIGVFGKLGTTYGRTDTAVMGAGPQQNFGMSWGGGVSYQITPRLSATFELDSHELSFAGGVRDPVFSTSLGLRYRY
jgi:OmpA-OmpF porin, OOP family